MRDTAEVMRGVRVHRHTTGPEGARLLMELSIDPIAVKLALVQAVSRG